MNRVSTAMCLTLLLAAVFVTPDAQASLIGDTILLNIDGAPIGPAVVGGGPEYVLEVASQVFAIIDVGSEDILVSLINNSSQFYDAGNFVGTLSDLDWLPDPGSIVGVNIAFDSFEPPVTVAWSSDSVSVAYSSGGAAALAPEDSWDLHLQLVVEHDASPAIPEPATMSLLGLGLAGVALRARRRMS